MTSGGRCRARKLLQCIGPSAMPGAGRAVLLLGRWELGYKCRCFSSSDPSVSTGDAPRAWSGESLSGVVHSFEMEPGRLLVTGVLGIRDAVFLGAAALSYASAQNK